MKIYVASSWRNKYQPNVVKLLRSKGHDVYDFRNPYPGNQGFSWSEIDPNWQQWNTQQYLDALDHPIATSCFYEDMHALQWANLVVLVLPCGRSAHLEAGNIVGRGLPLIIYLPEPQEPELMYSMAYAICGEEASLLDAVAEVDEVSVRRCRVCGCDELHACQDFDEDGRPRPCHWVEDDLCSACVDSEEDEDPAF